MNCDAFIEDEALPGTGISSATFWSGLAALVRDFGERNRQRRRRCTRCIIMRWMLPLANASSGGGRRYRCRPS